MADDGEARVVRGASLLILLQVVSRAITFIANQLLLRFMTAQLLGISTQLEVYYLSVLFFARESLRVAIQRQGSPSTHHAQSKSQTKEKDNSGRQATQADSTQAVVNLGYIAIILGLITAVILGGMYLTSVPEETKSTPNFIPAVYIYAFASVLELLSEPAFVVMQIRLQFTARARAEAIATFSKCLVTLSSAVWASRQGIEFGVLPFALGQIAYGVGLLGVYTWYGTALAGQEGFSLLPRRLGGSNEYFLAYFYRPTLNLASSMMVQSFVKHLLTQGDTFLVSILSTPTAQGVYALANNYGGLVARLVFQPVEESSRSYFSRLLSSPTPSHEQSDCDAPHMPLHQTNGPLQTPPPTPPKRPPLTALHQASANLTSLLQAYVFVSLPLVALGPVAAPLLLSLVAGPQWTSSGAGDALAAYVYYIPLLALNGLTEAFVASVATEAEVHVQSVWMMGFSFAFALAGWILMHVLDMGAVGLVAANGINMGCRIVWAVAFIRHYFATKGAPWEARKVLPTSGGVAAAVLAASVVRRVAGEAALGAQVGFQAVMEELVKIAAVAVPFLGVLYVPKPHSAALVFLSCPVYDFFYVLLYEILTPLFLPQRLHRTTIPHSMLPDRARWQSSAGPCCL